MKVEKHDGASERRILIDMIVSDTVLGAVASRWDDKGMLPSRWGNLIGDWCVKYYRKYGRAPGRKIEALFDKWASSTRDKETVKLIEQFLISLNSDYVGMKKESQPAYALDSAAEYLTRVRVLDAVEQAKALVDRGKVNEAAALLSKPQKVEIATGKGIDVLRDLEALRRAFESRAEVLVTYPGAAGRFWEESLARDSFVALEGREKIGKSYWLQDIGWRAMKQGYKVAVFQVGDLSEGQAMIRWAVRAAQRPVRAPGNRWPYKMRYPTSITCGGKPRAEVTHKEKLYKHPLTFDEGRAALEAVWAEKKRKYPLLRMEVHPMNSISAVGIMSVLEQWERNYCWVPDVVTVDYADILAAIDPKMDKRDQVNENWMTLKRISQTYHCLVATLSQISKSGYDNDILDIGDYSEDKRKRAHTTGTAGINQSDEEKEAGTYRLNWLFGRDWEYSRKTCLHTAGCLGVANPCVLSTF